MSCDNRCAGDDTFPVDCSTCGGRQEPPVIPIEAILAIMVAGFQGHTTPHWLCMNEAAKAEYVQRGKNIVQQFIDFEMVAKKSREDSESTRARRRTAEGD